MDYYQILGVPRTSGAQEIKRAYRKLAVTYHPDKNPSPQAENIFKEINEAYDVLGDPQKRRAYDMRFEIFEVPEQEPIKTNHRDPKYNPGATRGPRKRQQDEIREFMAQYLPIAQWASIGCFVLCMVMLMDYIWPQRTSAEEVIGTNLRRSYARNSSITWWVIHTNGSKLIDLPFEFSEEFPVGQQVTIHSSYFFNKPRGVQTGKIIVPIKNSIYGNFVFAPAALLLISFLGVLFRKNIDYGFNLGVISFVVLIFMGAIILIL